MKQLFTLCAGLIFTLSVFAQSQNIQMLYNWTDTTLVGSSTFNNTYNEVWGFEVNSHEFAVIGSTYGTHIFDITDLNNVSEVARIPGADQGPSIIHRDYHDYQGYLYAVADEGASTLQIIDISNLPTSYSVVYDSDALFKRAHNIFIDTATGKMYGNGVAVNNQTHKGFQCYDLSNPVAPVHVSDYSNAGLTHDTYARNDTVFINAGNNGLYVLDYSDPLNPAVLGTLFDYPFKGYNHSGWLNDDGTLYFMADENKGHEMKALDVSDLSNISVISTFYSDEDPNSMAHNQIWLDGYLFTAHYHDGLQIFDVSDPANPVRTGYYKTYQPSDYTSYRGAWGVYPYLSSGKILVSDMQYGLFVFDASQALSANEEIQSVQARVYPNPSQGDLQFDFAAHNERAPLEIFSMDGRMVYQDEIRSGERLSLNLSPGLYIGKIQTQNGSAQVKFMIQ